MAVMPNDDESAENETVSDETAVEPETAGEAVLPAITLTDADTELPPTRL